MPTPTFHISAKNGEFAETVLMPGDPLRAKYIAENYLENPEQINYVRGMLGYTGTYKGKAVSVQGSGMGMPSMGIYSYELFNFYNVENIIRIGSAAAIRQGLDIGDLVLGLGACTDSNFAATYELPGMFAPTAAYELIRKAKESADRIGLRVAIGNILSTDVFYDDNDTKLKVWSKMGVLAVEMEAAALYMNAARAGKNALCICTISDNIITGQSLSAEERQNTFTQMMETALGML